MLATAGHSRPSSAASAPSASARCSTLLLPLPLTPVMHVSRFSGILIRPATTLNTATPLSSSHRVSTAGGVVAREPLPVS
jgi:hypothetical protein